MAQIEYCEKPKDVSWNPGWAVRDFCEEAWHADIDAWFEEREIVWFLEPHVLVVQPPTGPQAEQHVQEKFTKLAREWREQIRTTSSTTDRVLASPYQDIIGMGESVVKYILRDMQANGGHWFWALRHITHTNPVPQEDAGKINEMTEAWLRWGQENGYL